MHELSYCEGVREAVERRAACPACGSGLAWLQYAPQVGGGER